jgi:hypothetical protein
VVGLWGEEDRCEESDSYSTLSMGDAGELGSSLKVNLASHSDEVTHCLRLNALESWCCFLRFDGVMIVVVETWKS